MTGARFCGTVEIAVGGKPETIGYSHCRSCWLGGSNAVIVE